MLDTIVILKVVKYFFNFLTQLWYSYRYHFPDNFQIAPQILMDDDIAKILYSCPCYMRIFTLNCTRDMGGSLPIFASSYSNAS